MTLVQLLLPLYDNQGQAFPKALFDQVRADLTNQFGGVTAFVRSPAVGVWEDDGGTVRRDDVVLLEVMVDAVDRDWWGNYRRHLESLLSQDAIVIRATAIDLL